MKYTMEKITLESHPKLYGRFESICEANGFDKTKWGKVAGESAYLVPAIAGIAEFDGIEKALAKLSDDDLENLCTGKEHATNSGRVSEDGDLYEINALFGDFLQRWAFTTGETK